MTRSPKGQTMVLNQFSRRQFKPSRPGRLTTKRPIKLDNLLLSGTKPVPPSSSSLFKNIAATLKENENPESRVSLTVDEFWAVERQKRISAVARRKLTGANETVQEINQQPVEDRKTLHARSRRVGGKRTIGAKLKLDLDFDAELIANWDMENLEEEEEKPCTIASSEAFISAQETALKATFPILRSGDHLVQATCSPNVKTKQQQVEACPADGQPKKQTPWHDNQANDAKSSSSLKDMDLSSGESPDCPLRNITNPDDNTPDLASLVEMDWNTNSPTRVVLHSVLNSQDFSLYRVQDVAGDCNLDKDVSCANHDSTPLHDRTSQRAGLPMTSPTPPSNPLAVYMSKRQPFGQRRLAFDSSSSSSSLDIGKGCQNEDIPDLEVDWDSISYNEGPHHVDASERDHEVEVVPCQETESERSMCDAIQSQESCSMDVKMSEVRSEVRHKSGSNSSTDSLTGKRLMSPGVDDPRNYTVTAIKMKESEKTGNLNALVLEGAETPKASEFQVSAFKSDKRKQAEEMSLANKGPNEDTPRSDETPFVPIKSVKQIQKTKLSCAAKSLRFKGEEMDGPRVWEPVTASKPVENKQAGQRSLLSAAKAFSFEDVEVESTVESERVDLLIEEPQKATEVKVSVPVDIGENTSQPCADLQSLSDNVKAGKLQAEPRRAKKPRTKKQNKRSSLEGSENGCAWKDGIRRSQRIRVRPLEWWRGEKLLYGRIHDSLTTVIGIKHSSPGQYARGLRAPFVIDSLVPDMYRDLVEYAAI